MPLISCLLTCGCGWLIYHLIHRHKLEISPATLALIWVLGSGVIYCVYFVSIAVFHSNPSPLIFVLIGAIGLIDLLRVRQGLQFHGWDIFREDKWAGIAFFGIVGLMSLSLFFSGFYADTARMWLAKAEMLNQLPDYTALIRSLPMNYHPDYPMLLTHQYQWQSVWSESVFSLKLPAWLWYISLLLAASHFLSRWTNHPLRWLCLLAGFPQYWWLVPIATADLPLSALWIIGISWLVRYLEGEKQALISAAFSFALLMLTKNEGILILACTLAGLAFLWIQNSLSSRLQILRAMMAVLILSGLAFFSWYGLIVGGTGITIGGDFGLSGFDLARIPQILTWLLPILFNPFMTALLWLAFLLFIILGYRQEAIIWLPALLYLCLISASYFFSVRPTEIEKHIIQSYFRLLLHITPLAMIYIASCFSHENSS